MNRKVCNKIPIDYLTPAVLDLTRARYPTEAPPG